MQPYADDGLISLDAGAEKLVISTEGEVDVEDRAGVIGMPDDRLGQKVAAAVELVAGAAASIDALRDHAAGQVAHFKVPVEWRIVATLPMTASGKVRKVELPGLFERETQA